MTSAWIDFSRRSDFRHLLLESARQTEDLKKLVPVRKGDPICMFSDHQSAIVIRRISGEHAVCGAAVIEFRKATWLEKLRRRTTELRKARKRNDESSQEGTPTCSHALPLHLPLPCPRKVSQIPWTRWEINMRKHSRAVAHHIYHPCESSSSCIVFPKSTTGRQT